MSMSERSKVSMKSIPVAREKPAMLCMSKRVAHFVQTLCTLCATYLHNLCKASAQLVQALSKQQSSKRG